MTSAPLEFPWTYSTWTVCRWLFPAWAVALCLTAFWVVDKLHSNREIHHGC